MNRKFHDPFYKIIAESAFQVEALARALFPQGLCVKAGSTDEAVEKTRGYLTRPEVVIFQPALVFDNFLAQPDILIKKGNVLKIIEVKAKSMKPNQPFYNQRRARFFSSWSKLLLELAFQRFVVSRALVELKIENELMFLNKQALAEENGIVNQFQIYYPPHEEAILKNLPSADVFKLPSGMFLNFNITNVLNDFLKKYKLRQFDNRDVSSWFYYLNDAFTRGKKISSEIGTKCKSCEFRIDVNDSVAADKCSGFTECWQNYLDNPSEKLVEEEDLVIDLWNSQNCQHYLSQKKNFIVDLNQHDIDPVNFAYPGIAMAHRQWLQIYSSCEKQNLEYFDRSAYLEKSKSWKYPFHFIDFETLQTPVPLFKNTGPYDSLAFQFSHHQVEKDGKKCHKGQFIYEPGQRLPVFDFVRALKSELDKDDGTIFCYGEHENHLLSIIFQQVYEADENMLKDKKEILEWIPKIARIKGPYSNYNIDKRRELVDLHRVARYCYFTPLSKGSLSIKKLLPALLNHSDYLKTKYAAPVYGKNTSFPSLNFGPVSLIRFDEKQRVINPYELLPAVFDDTSLRPWLPFERLNDGGSAMCAYLRLYYRDISASAKENIKSALLKYCELDTLAMVLIWEHFEYLKDSEFDSRPQMHQLMKWR
ncbi:MAG: DUF2779 domain-containing protein [Spirochaetales bacterium]|nr:DUF2779 domain-containing protein [Spirochaetales bacterium]